MASNSLPADRQSENNSETQSHLCGRLCRCGCGRAHRAAWLRLSLAARAGGRRSPAAAAISSASTSGVTVVAAENFWGSIAGQIAGNRANVQSIITNPAQDPHSYEPTAQRRARAGHGPARDRQRRRLRPVGAEAAGGQPGSEAGIVLTSGTCSACTTGTTRTAGTTRPTSTSVANDDRDRSVEARPQARDLLRTAGWPASRPPASARYHSLIAQIKAPLRGRPGRRVGEHLRPPGAGARARPDHARQLHEGDQRGHRGQRAGHDHDAATRSRATRSRSGSTTRRTPRPRSSA